MRLFARHVIAMGDFKVDGKKTCFIIFSILGQRENSPISGHEIRALPLYIFNLTE